MVRAQGSLEYLIIISIAISITAVVTLLVVNYFSGQQDQYYYSSCRNAASTCKLLLSVDSLNACNECNIACNYSDGTEIFTGAISCCKVGHDEGIYTGSTDCTNLCTSADDCGGNACCDGVCCLSGQVCDAGACAIPVCLSDSDCPYQECSTAVCMNSGEPNAYCSYTASLCFTEALPTDLSSPAYTVAIGDADNDGLNEVVVGLQYEYIDTATLKMYEYGPTGWTGSNIWSVSTTVESLAIGDANNDGKNEILAGTWDGKIRMYSYNLGVWTEKIIADTESYVYDIAIGDVTHDLKNDIVVGLDFGNPYELMIYENKSGTWVPTNIYITNENVLAVAIGDANNDGKNDILFGTIEASFSELRIAENKSGGWSIGVVSGPSSVYDLSIADANLDGKKDVLLAGYAWGRLIENKSGAWVGTLLTPYMPDAPPRAVGIGDVNRDGQPEVVFGFMGQGVVNELRMYSYSSGVWTEQNISDLTGGGDYEFNGIHDLSIGDADNNGLIDIAIAIWYNIGYEDEYTNELRIYTYN